MATAVYRHCAECGAEYQRWVERCADCDVPLGAPLSADVAPPVIEETLEPDRRTTTVAIDDLSTTQQERLRMLLRGTDIRFEMTADQVWFPRARVADVEALLEDAREIGDRPEGHRPRRRARAESRARPDRQIVTPLVEATADEPFEYVGAWPRGLAKLIDAWVIGICSLLWSLVLAPIPYATGVFLVTLFASFESLFGRTPGKAVVGIRVENVEGHAPSISAAMIRNSWQLLALVPVLGPWLILLVEGGIGWLVRQEPMHRGPHDLVARTFVVRSREPIRHRLLSSERARSIPEHRS